MTRADAIQFLDLYLEEREKVKAAVPDGVKLVDGFTGIHFWDVRPLIDALGVKFEHTYNPDLEFPHKIAFLYRGVTVFAIYTEEEFKGVNEWMTKE